MKSLDPSPKLDAMLEGKEIESHSSQLTNYRQHMIELRLDIWRAKVRVEPDLDNIVGLFGELEALFGYFQSLRQSGKKKDDAIDTRIDNLEKKFREFRTYWQYLKLRVETPYVHALLAKHRGNTDLVIQSSMVELCNEIADDLRKAYQSLNFYFRTGKRILASGLEGDLINARLRKKKHEKRTEKEQKEEEPTEDE